MQSWRCDTILKLHEYYYYYYFLWSVETLSCNETICILCKSGEKIYLRVRGKSEIIKRSMEFLCFRFRSIYEFYQILNISPSLNTQVNLPFPLHRDIDHIGDVSYNSNIRTLHVCIDRIKTGTRICYIIHRATKNRRYKEKRFLRLIFPPVHYFVLELIHAFQRWLSTSLLLLFFLLSNSLSNTLV